MATKKIALIPAVPSPKAVYRDLKSLETRLSDLMKICCKYIHKAPLLSVMYDTAHTVLKV